MTDFSHIKNMHSQGLLSRHLLTRIYYSETHRFQQHDDNFDFATLTSTMAAAADELIRLIVFFTAKDD